MSAPGRLRTLNCDQLKPSLTKVCRDVSEQLAGKRYNSLSDNHDDLSRNAYTASTIVALAMQPPLHIVCSPQRLPREPVSAQIGD